MKPKAKRARKFSKTNFLISVLCLFMGTITSSYGLMATGGLAIIISIILDIGADILDEVEK